jgi:hypothetical protein
MSPKVTIAFTLPNNSVTIRFQCKSGTLETLNKAEVFTMIETQWYWDDVDRDVLDSLSKEVQLWSTHECISSGYTCLVEKEASSPTLVLTLLVLRDDGNLVGLATLGTPRWIFSVMDNEYQWRGNIVKIFHCVTAEPGYGRDLMRAIAEECVQHGWELRWNCTDGSRGFYEHIGFQSENGYLFCVSAEELREWLL